MQTNNKIRLAVMSAISLFAIASQNNAYALGMSDIEVKSHLGQPLKANIKLQGASELKDESCFTVVDNADNVYPINAAQFKLHNIGSDNAYLTVTTKEIMNEPIANLSVFAACDANIRRDFTLLLDPLLVAEPNTGLEITPTNSDINDAEMADLPAKKSTNKTSSNTAKSVENSANQQLITTKNKKQRRNKVKNSNNENNENIVLTTKYSNQQITNKTADISKPRLTISGGTGSADTGFETGLNSLQLRLDNTLHLNPTNDPQAFAAEVAVQDEVTVMNNRLENLERQINALRQRNQVLETKDKLKTEQIAADKTSVNLFKWLPYLAGAGLLIGGYFAADWYRRRRQNLQLETAEMQWDKLNDGTNSLTENDDFAFDDNFSDDIDSQKIGDTGENLSVKAHTFVPTAVEELPLLIEEENVLDHADVFLSHGRSSLAIQLLQNHLLDFPKQSVTIWLFLLDLLAKENLPAIYEQTALECKEHFNMKIADFSRNENETNTSLESFPHLTSGLQQLWGKTSALTYLDDLIYNSRLEVRVGFHKNVIEELLLLKNIAQEELKTAEVIQMDEKKLAMKELKDAQLAAKREEKLKNMDPLPELKELEDLEYLENADDSKPSELFEFTLIENVR
jgi:hypothetical protein